MKHKKVLALVLSVLFVLICLAACGGSKQKNHVTKSDYEAIQDDMHSMSLKEIEKAFGMKGEKDEDSMKFFEEQGHDVEVYVWPGPTEEESVRVVFSENHKGDWRPSGITTSFK